MLCYEVEKGWAPVMVLWQTAGFVLRLIGELMMAGSGWWFVRGRRVRENCYFAQLGSFMCSVISDVYQRPKCDSV